MFQLFFQDGLLQRPQKTAVSMGMHSSDSKVLSRTVRKKGKLVFGQYEDGIGENLCGHR